MKKTLILIVVAVQFGFGFAAAQVEDDFSSASVETYRQKAENGDSQGQYLYAKALAYGLSVPKDEKKAFDYAQKSASAGNSDGLNLVGVCYQYGLGCVKNDGCAVKYYEKAVAKGNIKAKANLALCYMLGNGAVRNERKGMDLLEAAANEGSALAKYKLALCRIYGFCGCKKDIQQGVPIVQEYALKGDLDAMLQMGILCENGLGVERDYNVAREWFEKAAAQGNGKAKEKLEIYAKKPTEGQSRLVQGSVLNLCESIYHDSADLFAEEIIAAEMYLSSPQMLAKLNLRQKATVELFHAVLESKIRKNFYCIKDGKVEGGSFYYAYRLATEYPSSYFAHWAYEKMLEWSHMMSDESGANETKAMSSAKVKRRIRQGLKVDLLDRMCKSIDESKIWRGGMSRDSVMSILDIPKDVRAAYDIAVPCWKRDFAGFSFGGVGLGARVCDIQGLGKKIQLNSTYFGREDVYVLNHPTLGFSHCRLWLTKNYGVVRKIELYNLTGVNHFNVVREALQKQGVVFPKYEGGRGHIRAEHGDVSISLYTKKVDHWKNGLVLSIVDEGSAGRDEAKFKADGCKMNNATLSRLSAEIDMTKRWIDESNEIADGASGVCGLALGMSIADVLKQKSLWTTWDYCGVTNEGVRIEKDSIEFDMAKKKESVDRRIHLVLQKPFRGMKDVYLEFTPLSRLYKIEVLARWDGSDGGLDDELSVILDLLAKKFSRADAPVGLADYEIDEKNSLSLLESQFLRIESGIILPNVRVQWRLIRTHITNRKGWRFEHKNGASYETRLIAYKKQVSLDSFDGESLLGNVSMKSGYQKAFCLESDAILFHDECCVRLEALEKEKDGLESEVKTVTQEDLDAL